MAKTLAELRQARATLMLEGNTLSALETLTADQEARLGAVKTELEGIEAERCTVEDAMSTAEQVAQAVAAGVTGANKRAADITAACDLAGKPNRAHAYITSGKTAEAVVTELKAEAAEPSDDVNARSGKSAGKPDTKAAWDKVVGKVNARIPG
jgi:hypothetical protein